MKIATIVPTAYLSLIEEDTYFMALAHLVGKDQAYTDFFRRQSEAGKYVIMDNGAAERQQQPIEVLLERAALIKATELILPDVLLNCKETLRLGYSALEEIDKCGVRIALMAVPQGESFSEWIRCAQGMTSWPVQVIGISKFLTKRLGSGARLQALTMLETCYKEKDVHLLGCHQDPREVHTISVFYPSGGHVNKLRVRGVDSAIAYAYARVNQPLRPAHPRPEMEIDFSDTKTDSKYLKWQIRAWKYYCQHGEEPPQVPLAVFPPFSIFK